jgi:carbonic anhydrase/acetyltransferase-like protein (isoleucine patch superfamily)
MNSPAYLVGKITQRANYNIGKVLKEAGLAMDRFGSRLLNDVAYMQELSRHRQTMSLYDVQPAVDDAWVAPNASLIGEVIVSKYATVWYNVVIRAELNPVRIGHFSSVGDGTTIKTACSLPHGLSASVNIGKNVTIEPHCSLYSCIIDDDVYIGKGTVVMQGARIERGAHILAGSVVPPGRLIPAGQVWGGNPITYVRDLAQDELVANYAKSYTNSAPDFS